MVLTLGEIKEIVGGKLIGPPDLKIQRISPIEVAEEGDITFLTHRRYLSYLTRTRASAIILDMETPPNGKPAIQVKNPHQAVVKLLRLWETRERKIGVDRRAVIGENVELGEGVYIGPFTVVEDGVRIGKNSVIQAHCYLGKGVVIGEDCFLHPRVTVEKGVRIGNRVIIQSGAVIGSEGFGYYQENGKSHRIPHLGSVVIEDDVEIGAGTTIDRGTLQDTVIGEGTKIDNLVQIAHNVVIGKNCLLVAQVGISGSVKIGDNVILAGQVGVCDHVRIGDGVKVLARSVVTKDIPPGKTVSGFPARDHREELRIKACLAKLPELIEKKKKP